MSYLDIKQEDLWSYLDRSSSPVALYGTGDGADKIIKVLEDRGLGGRVQAVFASDGFVRDRSFRGFKVESFDDVRARLGDGMTVLVCFGSSRPEVLANIERISGICKTFIPDVPVCGETVFDAAFVSENKDRLQHLYDLLEDDISRRCYENYINYKLTGRPDLLQNSETPDDEKALLGNVLSGTYFLDLGAYNGDTVKRYMELLPDPEGAVAVEPERHSYRKLETACEGYGGKVIPVHALISDHTGDGVMTSSHGRGSRSGSITGAGEGINKVKTVPVALETIDSLMEGKVPGFIKFDVEGAELEALRGGIRTIEKHGPVLMVSCYHRSEDVFVLPEEILKIRSDYRMYIRRSRCIPGWDIAFWFVPKT